MEVPSESFQPCATSDPFHPCAHKARLYVKAHGFLHLDTSSHASWNSHILSHVHCDETDVYWSWLKLVSLDRIVCESSLSSGIHLRLRDESLRPVVDESLMPCGTVVWNLLQSCLESRRRQPHPSDDTFGEETKRKMIHYSASETD